MAQVRHETAIAAPTGVVWDYVRDMDRWAPFITGYQAHERHSDTRSTWTVRGDVGPLARTVRFDVEITEWVEGEHVAFVLTGINEQMNGRGVFSTTGERPRPVEPSAVEPSAAEAPSPPPAGSWWSRLRARFGRWAYRRMTARAKRASAPVPQTAVPDDGGAPTDAGVASPAGSTILVFDLEMEAGGMMGPVINAMIQPLLAPAAEDLAASLRDAIERASAAG